MPPPHLAEYQQHLDTYFVLLLCPARHYLSQTNVQNVFEDSFKVPVAERVYKRIEGGVDVTQPYGKHVEVMVHTLSAERHHHESYEVRDPTQQESSDYEAQLLGCLVLLMDPQALDALTRLVDKPLPRLSQSHRIIRVQFGIFDPFFGPGQSVPGVIVVVEHGGVPLHV